jgi:N-acetyl-anhydromuramyl-L-alanine amidase AmpD
MLQLLLALSLHPTIIERPFAGRLRRDTSDNIVVIHYDSGTSLGTTLRYLRRHGDAYHYVIDQKGTIVKLIDPAWEARHAGLSFYSGHFRLNHYSIGVCLQNDGVHAYTDRQYGSLAWLVTALHKRYPDITAQKVVGHSDIAIPRGRKADPGTQFDWGRFRRLVWGDSS